MSAAFFTDHLTTVAASGTAIATPSLMAASGDPPDFGMRMLWYAVGGAIVALGAWSKILEIRRRSAATATGPDGEECRALNGVSHEQHSRELSEVYQKLEAMRRELDAKIGSLSQSTSKVAQDVAAGRAETRTLTTAVQAMLKLIGTGNPPH